MIIMIKFIDLFAGIGGIRLAFENVGAICVMSSEIDKKACETYKRNFNEYPLSDVKELLESDIPDFSILAGGFPCQPFSIGGLRKGFNDTRGTLFFEIIRILNLKKPEAFLLENVSGLVSHDKGNTLKVIEQELDKSGYNLGWKVLNAKDYGVPQNRNRWYCVGFRKDMDVSFSPDDSLTRVKAFKFPSKRDLKYTLEDIINDEFSDKYLISKIARNNIQKFLPKFMKSKRYNKDNILIANEIRKSRCQFRSDGISPCLTAKMGTGGNNVPVVVSQKRKLTERECLKIMGFPDDFQIEENTSHAYKQIGNSVAVPVVELLAREIVRMLK